MISIQEYPYSAEAIRTISYWQFSTNWPVVYIMHNDTEAYVGETLDGIRRTRQHLEEDSDTEYKLICMVSDKDFNKSVILDMESFLIKYMSADGRFKLQNGNAGVADHNYFNREIYQDKLRYTWDKLIERGLAIHTLSEIENSDLFKYSPYKALTADQNDALLKILCTLRDHNNNGNRNLIVVKGGAGTGKTILAVYLVKILKEIADGQLQHYQHEDGIENMDFLRSIGDKLGHLKVGFVVPMQSLRESLKTVFRSISGLSADMILRPEDVVNDYYDLLIVDEAHRLHRRASLAQYPSYDKVNTLLGLAPDATQLEWIIQCSRMQLIFYDSEQSVRPSDIKEHQYQEFFAAHQCETIELISQLRCKGGNDYIDYVKAVLHGTAAEKHKPFDDYELRFFDNPNEMIAAVRIMDKKEGLCRVVAGYGWKWKSKKDPNAYDIVLNGVGYKWNTTATDWINHANSVNEIGCIHTVQGYDLNIAGVIFGPEIIFSKEKQEIMIDKKSYFDSLVKTQDDNAQKEYIIQIYETLMTRGIKGTYVYVYDQALREYLAEYFR